MLVCPCNVEQIQQLDIFLRSNSQWLTEKLTLVTVSGLLRSLLL